MVGQGEGDLISLCIGLGLVRRRGWSLGDVFHSVFEASVDDGDVCDVITPLCDCSKV